MVDLRDVVTKALQTCRRSLEAAGHVVEVEFGAEALLAPVDPDLIANAVCALVTACKRGPTSIAVRAWRTQDDVAIAVIETELTTTDRARRAPRACRGEGLAMVERIAKRHGGVVEASSAGSTVVLRVPRITASSARRCVLVVEDGVDVGTALGDLLRYHGLDVHVAPDGRTALSVAAEVHPALALVDLGLPDMDGHQVGRRLRAMDATTVIVALTGRSARAEVDRCLAAGFDQFVTKPIRVQAIRELLRLAASRRSVPG